MDILQTSDALFTSSISTPLGEMLVWATEKGVCLLQFNDEPIPETLHKALASHFNDSSPSTAPIHIEQLKNQLIEYFEGSRFAFDIPLYLHGTVFQIKSWRALQTIPYGQTRSYQQQAESINRPKAVRAVANANRNNPIEIVIPCHRVIGKNGRLTGYAGGIWRKQFLLDHEQRHSFV